MNRIDYRIGATVTCRGGTCGKLEHVVLDPHTRRVTDLIVQRGLVTDHRVVVDEGLVKTASGETIELNLEDDQLDELPEYDELNFREPPANWESDIQFTAPPVDWEERGEQRRDLMLRQNPHGVAYPRAEVDVPDEVHEGIDSDRIVVERGTDVVDNEGHKRGTLDHVLLDPTTGQLTDIVVRQGILAPSVVIPVARISSMSEEAIVASLGPDEWKTLTHYKQRAEPDVMAELNDRLADQGCGGEDLDINYDAGIVTLKGCVPDVETKRTVEGTARAVPGVIGVDNQLRTTEGTGARVAAALEADPRTDVSAIQVTADRDVVTLTGTVDDSETARAAEEIAKAQPGVREVVNHLEVGEDEHTAALRHRHRAIVRDYEIRDDERTPNA